MEKAFEIPKQLVWEAYLKMKANGGAAGVDEQSIEEFEKDLKGNLYKIWNRMSSGSYFPPPVLGVPIPKKSGGSRMLGIPTVGDRVAQMTVKLWVEPMLEPHFHRDSYGYRPKKSAHHALEVTRRRCWRYDWVVEFDIRRLFDNISHDLLLRALRKHCECKWVLLYVERWLKAPMQDETGKVVERTKGTPQGGVVSPLLANLFLHYAFDIWMSRNFPSVPFCRYADDGLLHCKTQKQAEFMLMTIEERFRDCGLEIHPDKSKIVYCKDINRRAGYERVSFDFLGFGFRPRSSKDKYGRRYVNFSPAISNDAKKALRQEIKSWHIQLKNEHALDDLSRMFNPVLRGWANYYCRFYKTAMYSIWQHMNRYLVRWVMRKYKRFAWHQRQAREWLNRVARANIGLFVHWQLGIFPAAG